MKLPEGWKVAGSTAWLRASGTAVAVSDTGTELTLATPLKQDLLLDVSLTRA